MSFTRKHYEETARIVRERITLQNKTSAQWPNIWNECRNRAEEAREIARQLSAMFAADNPRFDAARFAKACEPKGAK